MATHMATVALCLHTVLLTGCDKQPPPDEPAESEPASQAWSGRDPLALWNEGKSSEALDALGEWAGLREPPLLIEAMSERAFASLAPDRREQVRSKVMRQQRAMRNLAREVDRRARAALAAGDRATARSMAHMIKTLATTHQGERVLKITHLTSQAIEQVADKLLRDIGG